jgi:hypothetical protein
VVRQIQSYLLDAITTTAGECKIMKDIYEFAGDNEIFLDDVCRETGRFFIDVAKEYYAAYVKSYGDINNDY